MIANISELYGYDDEDMPDSAYPICYHDIAKAQEQGGIPEKESLWIANNKSDPNGRRKELVLRRPRDIPIRIPAEVSLLYQRKQRGIPERNPHLNDTSKYDHSGRPKEINS